MPDVLDHVAIQVYGPRNHLLGHFKVPAHALQDAPRLLDELKAKNPVWSWESLVRWMLRAGSRSVAQGLRTGQLPPP